MRTVFTLFSILSLSLHSKSQSICGTASEGQNLTLTAPAGKKFISVTFASYGTPNGSCGSFTTSACNAANSRSIVETALLGKTTATIPATNATFGDPCNGTVKRLYVEAVYAVVTPLELLSFSGASLEGRNLLQWQTVNEVNTKEFVIERSLDGEQFTSIATLKTNNRTETNTYSYSDELFRDETSLYRLKMIDMDGHFEYSQVVAVKNKTAGDLQILSNPVSSILTLNRLRGGWVELISIGGTVLQKIQVKNQTLQLNLSPYPTGTYFIRHYNTKGVSVHKIVKR